MIYLKYNVIILLFRTGQFIKIHEKCINAYTFNTIFSW